ncbi:MAG: DUF2309 domain-containing protein [Nitrospirales bacterium]|nr:DUF2309 domain-containing protein [Nitrospirales bacterium]
MTGSTAQEVESFKEIERIEVRSLIHLAGESISHFWPMQTFIHHNPLHGLEHLPIHRAIAEAGIFLGGRGYLPNREFRDLYRQGRILDDAITDAVGSFAGNHFVTIGTRNISHLEVLRMLLIHGTGAVPHDVRDAVFLRACEDSPIMELCSRLQSSGTHRDVHLSFDHQTDQIRKSLGTQETLAAWCDQMCSTSIQEEINQELIKWCAGFLDQGHAPWPMPMREKTFYGSWKVLAQREGSGFLLGIPDWTRKLQHLPDSPEDAVLACLHAMGLPQDVWSSVFTLHLAQLPGWTGFLKWRADQVDQEWQTAFPIDLVQYLAVRLFYERELVQRVCQDRLGIPGTYTAIVSSMEHFPFGYGLYRMFRAGRLNPGMIPALDESLLTTTPLPLQTLDDLGREADAKWGTIQRQLTVKGHALLLRHLAESLELPLSDMMECSSEVLDTLLEWITNFPDSTHGPLWLQAFEMSYVKDFVKSLSPNLTIVHESDAKEEKPEFSRPPAQAMFCIDVRSEGFRRHLEEAGGNETFGFAGFFGIPICFQGFGSEQETDQCPVLLKPKHRVREIPRAYQGKAAERFLDRQALAKTGHALLHDLKENVITPYVMVEAIGWFFACRLFGQTIAPAWYRTFTAWLKDWFAIPIATTLTVDKLSQEEAEEIVASEHRAAIYRLMIERYGRLGLTLSHDQVDRLRRQALYQLEIESLEEDSLYRLLGWNAVNHEQFLGELRKDYGIHHRAVSRRMHRITQGGFTTNEQAYFVETALRIIGFTKGFARLVLICAHGSVSENNPYESALDCGACGGNEGIANARAFAAMANKPRVRQLLAQKDILIPPDTHFLPGQHNTTTDEVELYDLEDVPATHRKDLQRLQHDLAEAGRRNSQERLSRLPDEEGTPSLPRSLSLAKRRSLDWSQVRPEWGLSRHSVFIIGRRLLTRGLNLEGRPFLHSYDYLQDPTGKYLEIIMTAPLIVGNWINMEHYFSTVDPEVYGAGSKVYHNVVGRIGVMSGSQSDLRIGLPLQTVYDGPKPYHEPMRLFAIIEAPLERISLIISRHDLLQKLIGNQWVNLVALDPVTMEFFLYQSAEEWRIIL